jgi:hypothetical protein
MTPRAIELDMLDRYARGAQYDGRAPDWFDNTIDATIFERRPAISYKIVGTAIGTHVDFVLGESRWPLLTSGTSEDDSTIDDEWGLDEDESSSLDAFVNRVLVKYAAIKSVAREMLTLAMGSRSVAAVVSVKAGRLCAETIKAGWCTPTLGDLGECQKLEISYPYIDPFWDDARNIWSSRCMLYRRVIDAVSDTTYVPVEGRPDGRKPVWVVDKIRTVQHGLGVCPVIWYPFRRGCANAQTVDGVALHDNQTREVDCLNITLSQKQRASITSGDPQAYETGVGEGDNPAPSGSRTTGMSLPVGAAGADGKVVGAYQTQASPRFQPAGGARKRGAGIMWRYPNENTKVDYLQLDPGSLAAMSEHGKDLRGKLAEAFWAVLLDPTELKMHAALSGKSLAFMFSRQTAFDDGVRDDFFEHGLAPLVHLLLRTVYILGKKNPRSLYLPGVKKILPILERFMQETAGDDGASNGGSIWMPCRIDAVWGPYFAPDEQDQLFVVQLVAAAKEAGLTTLQMCLEKLSSAGVFEIGDAASVIKAIQKETAERMDQQSTILHDSIGVLNGGSSKPTPKPGAAGGGGGTPSGKKSANGPRGRPVADA